MRVVLVVFRSITQKAYLIPWRVAAAFCRLPSPIVSCDLGVILAGSLSHTHTQKCGAYLILCIIKNSAIYGAVTIKYVNNNIGVGFNPLTKSQNEFSPEIRYQRGLRKGLLR